MWLFVLFIAVPLIEIALFIQVGGILGLWPTLLIVVVTAMLGTFLVRSQGMAELSRLRQSMDQLRDPTESLVHGAMILFSGALLLTPGFFTDAVGFALLVPAFRTWAFRALRNRVKLHTMSSTSAGGFGGPGFGAGGPSRGSDPKNPVIDGDYTEVEPEKRPTHGSSQWTKH